MKKTSKIKRIACIGLIFLMSINTFAAIVSDNDGSAFVTKAEFDALKTSFNKQIDEYNKSIDEKIDGSIASYLAGIQLATTEVLENTYKRLETDMRFSSLPLQTTNEKYYVKLNWQMLLQSDGYVDSGATLGLGYKTNSTYSSGGTGVYNTYGAIDASNYYYYGYVSGDYASSIYNFTGVVMTNKGGGTGVNFTIPTDGVNPSEYTGSKPSSSSYGWGSADTPRNWYKFTPNTAGWGAKDSFWTRGDTYNFGTSYNYQGYMASGAVSSATYDMIDINNRTVDATSVSSTTTLTTGANTGFIMSENNYGLVKAKLSADVRYFYPKVKNLNIQNLYNGTTYSKLNRKIKLYEGLPLFTATDNGKVKFKFKANSSSSSYPNATFYMRDDTSFENNDTPVGDAKMTIKEGTNTYTDVTSFTMERTKTYEVEMEVKKNHEYWFKIKPTSGGYFYVNNFTDIELSKDA